MEPFTHNNQTKPTVSQNQIFSYSTKAESNYLPLSQPDFYYQDKPAPSYSQQNDTYDQFQDLFDNHLYFKQQDQAESDNASNHADSGSMYERSISKKENIQVKEAPNKRGQLKELKRSREDDFENRVLRKTQFKLREMDRFDHDNLPDPRDLLAEFQKVRERTLKGMMMKEFSDIVLNSSLQRKNNRKDCSTNSDFFGVVTQNNRYSANIHVKLIKKQVYLGSFSTPLEAAFQYDIGHVLLHGLKAKTNFSYSKEAVIEMMSTEYLFDVIHKKYYC